MKSAQWPARALVFVVLLLPLCFGFNVREAQASVVAGVVDLTATADQDGVTTLDGEWWYAWGQLVVPTTPVESADGLYQIPNTWDIDQAHFSAQSGQGFASFSITLINIPDSHYWGIVVPEQSTAFRLYLDDQLLASGGQVATSEQDATAYSGSQVIKIGKLKTTAQLTLQISNFHHSSGGPWQALSIGPYHELNERSLVVLFEESLVVSLACIASFFLLSQWLIDRREISSLLLAFFALAITLRLGITDHQPLYKLTGTPPWWLHIRIFYISKLLVLPFLLTWLHRIYPTIFNVQILRVLVVSTAAACLFILFSDTLVFTKFLTGFLGILTASMLFALYGIARVFCQRLPGGTSIAVGAAVLCGCTTHDMMKYTQVIESTGLSLVPVGILMFLLSLTINLVYLRANEKRQVEALSKELLQVNRTLETHVEERTKELAEKALALEKANQKLRILANLDGLTQLLNRRAFLEQCDLFARSEPEVCLLLIDVDHFKQVNDQFGHAAGDEVLVKLAKLLTSITRIADRVARFGGEEFVVLLSDTDLEAAIVTCERIVHGIRELEFDDIDGLPGITVSAGIASGTLKLGTIDQLIQQADCAMYEAKNNGRDGYRLAN